MGRELPSEGRCFRYGQSAGGGLAEARADAEIRLRLVYEARHGMKFDGKGRRRI